MEPSPFAARCGTNYVATDDEILEIQSLLEEPTAKLARLESRIEVINLLLKKLTQEHETMSLYIQDHRALISPLRRLPPEVQQEIFIHCLPTDNYAVMAVSEAPMLLTHVCNSWRQLALATPRLWSSIHIPIPSDNPQFYCLDYPDYPSTADEMVEKRSEAVQNWIERSGVCPLDISLNEWDGISYGNGYRDRVVDSIIFSSARWRKLSLTGPPIAMSRIAALSASDVPFLESLRINCSRSFAPTSGGLLSPWSNSDVFRAPRLCRLNLVRVQEDIANFPIRWSQITHLSLEGNSWGSVAFLTVPKLAKLLQSCGSLISCRFEVGYTEGDLDSENLPRISLPFLETLSIHETVNLSTFFKRLDVPALRGVEFHSNVWSVHESAALLTLLSRTNACIQTLVTDTQPFSREMFLECIRCCPSLKSLTLKPSPASMPSLPPWGLGSTPSTTRVDAGLLRLLTSSGEDDICLLPRLEVFECLGSACFSDADLLDCIQQRQSFSERGVSKLKSIAVTFNRRRDVDILPDIASYTAAGMKIKLIYTPDSFRGPFSPYDGLTVSNTL
ncbi:hypothetical protein B0H34DRAFT_826608 [Crassisporium funariophilum]|nr:hypothetical protein B0H34DRAFT_826608 [Crassisporium funariophilum]